MANKTKEFDFRSLVNTIRQVCERSAAQAGRAVNVSLTLRNWLIGFYLEEYERSGVDRAKYGERLMESLAEALKKSGLTRCDRRELYRYCQFYLKYPQIRESVPPQLVSGLLSAQMPHSVPDYQELMSTAQIVESVSPQLQLPGAKLLECLSYTHFVLLIGIDDPLKRAFYEIESIKGNWSVRELKRQIGSLYYERSGLSGNKEKLAQLARVDVEREEPALAIRDPYVFEFLGIKSKEVMGESDLEDALLDRLQDFLLELGHGFCFEARQKRILIGDSHGFVDLVFYHRILKCHILVELKVAEFAHEHLGQLNTYVSWYRKNVTSEGDNPPVGILLCSQRDHALMEYALAGMDNSLFVSKYQLELPDKEDIQRFLEKEMRDADGDGN